MAIGILCRSYLLAAKDDTMPFYSVFGLDQFIAGNRMAITASLSAITAYSGIPTMGMNRGGSEQNCNR